MFNLQGSEIIVILLLALVVLGPEKLPDAIRRFTQTYNELKKMGSGFQSEIKSALDEPMREMRATADLMKNSVDPDKLQQEAAAEAELQRQAEAEADRMAKLDEAAAIATADRTEEHTTAQRSTTSSNGADTTDDTSDVPSPPINQIAQANARGPIDNTIATPADVDTDAVPTFAGVDEADATRDDVGPEHVGREGDTPEDVSAPGSGGAADDDVDDPPASGDDVNEAAVT